MKKIIISFLFLLLAVLPIKVDAKSKVTIYFFRGYNCHYCEESLEYINKHKDEIPDNVEIVTYEVWKNENNEKLHQAVIKELDVNESYKNSVPFLVVGDQYKVGMEATDTDFKKLISMAEDALKSDDYKDVVSNLVKEQNIDVKSITFEDLYKGPNKTVTIVVYTIFGLVVLGIGAMIIFSRK